MEHYQAIVVGGGAAGLSAAWGLQSAGASTLCIAMDSPPALLAAAGMLLPALDDFSPAVQMAADWSYRAWADLGQQLGLDRSMHACGVTHYEGAVPAKVQAFEGRVVNTHDLYAACLKRLTHVVRAQVVACAFEKGFFYVTDSRGVQYSSDRLLLATGYSDRLPLCHGFVLPVGKLPRSVRGITLRCQGVSLDSILYWKKDARTVVYLAPWFDGSVVVGSTVTLDDSDMGWRTQEEIALLELACELLPGMSDCVVVERRVGLRPLYSTRDIGFTSLDVTGAAGAWWINGLFRNGVLWMPACAEIAANLYRQTESSAALDGFVHKHATA